MIFDLIYKLSLNVIIILFTVSVKVVTIYLKILIPMKIIIAKTVLNLNKKVMMNKTEQI
jgi:hypothetical protein